MGLHSLLFLALNAGCGDKGSDSAGEGDTDTDTDADTDTDTDTDADTEKYITGSVHAVVTSADGGTTLCDTNVDFTGEEFAGACLGCDFTLDIEATKASEAGTKCTQTDYPIANLLAGPVVDDVFLGWSDPYAGYYQTYSNILWFGFSETAYGYPGPYWQVMTFTPGGSAATYTGGLLEWSFDTTYYGTNSPHYYCGPYSYSGRYGYGKPYPPYGSPNYYGAYGGDGSLNCSYNLPYETWSFSGVDDTYAYISVDTVSADSTFDPSFYVFTDDLCWVARGDESFKCSYPPASGYLCPSVKFPTNTGEHYTILVQPYFGDGDCDNATGDYHLYVSTTSNPSLTEASAGDVHPAIAHVTADGTATITEK